MYENKGPPPVFMAEFLRFAKWLVFIFINKRRTWTLCRAKKTLPPNNGVTSFCSYATIDFTSKELLKLNCYKELAQKKAAPDSQWGLLFVQNWNKSSSIILNTFITEAKKQSNQGIKRVFQQQSSKLVNKICCAAEIKIYHRLFINIHWFLRRNKPFYCAIIFDYAIPATCTHAQNQLELQWPFYMTFDKVKVPLLNMSEVPRTFHPDTNASVWIHIRSFLFTPVSF